MNPKLPSHLASKAAPAAKPSQLPPPPYIPQSPAVQNKSLPSAPPAYTPFKNNVGGNAPAGNVHNAQRPMIQQKVNPAPPALQMKGGVIHTAGLPPQAFKPAMPAAFPPQVSVVPGAQYLQRSPLAANSIQLACNMGHPACPVGPCRLGALNQKGLVVGKKKNKPTSHHQHPRPKKGADKRRRKKGG